MSSDSGMPGPRGGSGGGRQYYVPSPAEQTPPSRAPKHSDPGQRRPAEAPGRPPKAPRRRRHGARRIVLLLALVAVLAAGALGVRAIGIYRRIDRIDLSQVLVPATGHGTTYLLVGSDSRAELDPDGSSGVTGARADTIILLHLTPSGSQMMSIPRDLWVTIADTGDKGRINGAYNRGPANLVRTISDNLDIPVNHYVEVGFGSFAGLVDALGGVPIVFPYPAFDTHSGLNVTEPGVHVLDGQQALAYARSRHFTQMIDGRQVTDPTADLGRQQRQQDFLRAALGELGNTRNPLALLRAGDSMSSELRVDSGLGLLDMYRLARRLGASSPQTVILPTRPARKGRAAVLVLDDGPAAEVLVGFR